MVSIFTFWVKPINDMIFRHKIIDKMFFAYIYAIKTFLTIRTWNQ
jgi:hypothetical protein